MSKNKDDAEDHFQEILEAARDLYDLVNATKKRHARHILRRLEQVTYESVEGEDDDEFSAELCLNALDVLDAVRLRVTADHNLPYHEHGDLVHRWSVSRAAGENGVHVDPTFAEQVSHV